MQVLPPEFGGDSVLACNTVGVGFPVPHESMEEPCQTPDLVSF